MNENLHYVNTPSTVINPTIMKKGKYVRINPLSEVNFPMKNILTPMPIIEKRSDHGSREQ